LQLRSALCCFTSLRTTLMKHSGEV
jgi:hypothetical protein